MSKRSGHTNGRLVIGWREVVALPDWGIDAVNAKADTGARTSAIDVLDLEELPGDRVRFHVARFRRNRDRDRAVEVIAPIARRSRVRSAHGTTQDRLFVTTTLRIGDHAKTVELGLVCRKRMICRMLIGRAALAGDFLVDSAQKHMVTEPRRRPGAARLSAKKKKKKKKPPSEHPGAP